MEKIKGRFERGPYKLLDLRELSSEFLNEHYSNLNPGQLKFKIKALIGIKKDDYSLIVKGLKSVIPNLERRLEMFPKLYPNDGIKGVITRRKNYLVKLLSTIEEYFIPLRMGRGWRIEDYIDFPIGDENNNPILILNRIRQEEISFARESHPSHELF